MATKDERISQISRTFEKFGEAVFSDIIGDFALTLRSCTHKSSRNKRAKNRHSGAIDVSSGFLTVRRAYSSSTRLLCPSVPLKPLLRNRNEGEISGHALQLTW